MPEIPLQFRWRVAKAATTGSTRALASSPSAPTVPHRRPADRRGGLSRVLQYQPLAEFPGLFRVFAETEPSHDGIKAFADRFGPLGADIATSIPLNDQRNAKGVPLGTGEPLAAWTQ